MKGLLLCNRGIEDIAALDVREIIGRNSECFDGYVLFDSEKNDELCRLAYLSQSIEKVLLVLVSFSFVSEDEIIERAGKLELKEWLNKERSFKVDANVIGADIEEDGLKGKIGKAIIESITDYKQKVDLDNPDIVVFVFVYRDKGYICIDFSGKDLSKRDYRIFSNPKSIKSTISYAMLRLSGFKNGEVLLDPFCLSGGITIEAALFENHFSPLFFSKDELLFNKFIEFDFGAVDNLSSRDKGEIYSFDSQFKNADSAKKNAKIAGVHKAINFSRREIEWLDTKFDEGSVDRIVTCLPNITKFSDIKDMLKIYREFFYQAEFIVKKKGGIVVCTKNAGEVKETAIEKGFKVVHEREVWQGKERLRILRIER